MLQNNQLYLGFTQIADLVSDRILLGQYPTGERIPSVRELSMSLEVNPQTVVRAYERLARLGIIYTQRGLGFFVTDEAIDLLKAERSKKLYEETLPALRKELELLQIPCSVVTEYLDNQSAS